MRERSATMSLNGKNLWPEVARRGCTTGTSTLVTTDRPMGCWRFGLGGRYPDKACSSLDLTQTERESATSAAHGHLQGVSNMYQPYSVPESLRRAWAGLAIHGNPRQ